MYHTHQLQALWDFFQEGGKEQYSSKEIIQALCRDGETGRSTIYRQLKKLTEEGELRRFHQDNKIYYQFAGKKSDCANHFHLKCKECGKLIHLDCDRMKEVAEHVAMEHGFELDMSKTVLYGRCDECAGKDTNNLK